jgi:hypothetical protein
MHGLTKVSSRIGQLLRERWPGGEKTAEGAGLPSPLILAGRSWCQGRAEEPRGLTANP